MSTDDELRALLRETGDQITPQGTLDDIKERTMAHSRTRWLPALGAAAALALVIGGIGWVVRDDGGKDATPAVTPPSSGPASPGNEEPSGSPTTSTGADQVTTYFIGATARGFGLYPGTRETMAEGETVPFQALRRLMVIQPQDPDYQNPWRGRPRTVGAGFDGADFNSAEMIQIDLDSDLRDRPNGVSRAQAELQVQQLVYSLQPPAGGVPVRVVIDGFPSETLLGVKLGEGGVVRPDPDALAPVQIHSPAEGEELPAGSVTVSGEAAAFEANVQWELTRDGAEVDSGFATARECCTLAPYEFTLENLAAGTYTITVHDTDESGAGLPLNQDTKEFIVR